jgi:hypothetical protein
MDGSSPTYYGVTDTSETEISGLRRGGPVVVLYAINLSGTGIAAAEERARTELPSDARVVSAKNEAKCRTVRYRSPTLEQALGGGFVVVVTFFSEFDRLNPKRIVGVSFILAPRGEDYPC